jgi:hypothetical protein
VIRRLLLLLAGSLAIWVLVSLPVRALADDPDTIARVTTYSGTALLLCLIPTALTLLWAARALSQSPEAQLAAVLGGTGVRLFLALAAGWMVHTNLPYYHNDSFWYWLLGAYLVTLALEMTLLLAGRTAPAAKP